MKNSKKTFFSTLITELLTVLLLVSCIGIKYPSIILADDTDTVEPTVEPTTEPTTPATVPENSGGAQGNNELVTPEQKIENTNSDSPAVSEVKREVIAPKALLGETPSDITANHRFESGKSATISVSFHKYLEANNISDDSDATDYFSVSSDNILSVHSDTPVGFYEVTVSQNKNKSQTLIIEIYQPEIKKIEDYMSEWGYAETNEYDPNGHDDYFEVEFKEDFDTSVLTYSYTITGEKYEGYTGAALPTLTDIDNYHVKVEISAEGYESFEHEFDYSIVKARLHDFDVYVEEEKTYYGDSYTPKYSDTREETTVTLGFAEAIPGQGPEGLDYSSTYPTAAATYYIKAETTGSEHYEPAVAYGPFTIHPKTITVTADVNVEDKVYDGTTDADITLENVVFDGKLDGDELGIELTGKFADANVGEEKSVTITEVIITGEAKNNYIVNFDKPDLTARIKRATMDDIEVVEYRGRYDGEPHTIEIKGYPEGSKISFMDENGDYTLKEAPTFTDYNYDSGLAKTVYYKITNPNYRKVEGQADVVILRSLVTVTAINASKTYGEDDPNFEVTIDGFVKDDDSIEYSINRDREGNNNVGPYDIVVSGKQYQGNYNVSFVNGTFTINPKEVTITAEDQTKIYGNKNPELTYTIDGLVSEDDEAKIKDAFTITRAQGGDAGSYDISFIVINEYKDNYHLNFIPGKFTIEQRTVRINWSNVPDSIEYNGEEQVIEAGTNGILAIDQDVVKINYTDNKQKDVGTYTAKITGLSGEKAHNYKLSETATLEKTFTITPKEVTVEGITVEPKTYDGTKKADINVENATIIDRCGDDDVRVTAVGEFDDINATAMATVNLTLSLEGDDAGNYVLTKNTQTITTQIKKRDLIVEWPVVEFVFNGQEQKPEPKLVNVVPGEEVEVEVEVNDLSSKLVGSVSAGEYTATIKPLSDNSNYALPTDGSATTSFKIVKAQINYTAPTFNENLEYNGNDQRLIKKGTSSAGAMVYALGDDAGNAPTEWKSSANSITGKDAGTYYVWYKIKGDNNYEGVDPIALGSVTIAQKTINVIADNLTKEYGDADPDLTYNADPLCGNDTFDGNLVRAEGTDPGDYDILQGSLSAGDNYIINFTNGTFTITKREITVSGITAKDKTYDGTNEVTLVYDDSIIGNGLDGVGVDDILDISGEFDDVNAGNFKNVNIQIELKEDAEAYYTIGSKQENTLASISKRPAQIEWKEKSFTYDGEVHIPEAYIDNIVESDKDKVTVEVTAYNTIMGLIIRIPTNPIYAGTYYATAASLESDDDTSKNYELSLMPSSRSTYFTIEEADVEIIDEPKALLGLEYNRTNQRLVENGEVKGGYIEYYNPNAWLFPWSTVIPTGRDAGTYTVKYRIAGDGNHKDDPKEYELEVTIAPKEVSLTWSPDSFVYDGEGKAPTATVEDLIGSDTATVTETEITNSRGRVVDEAVNVGRYTIEAKALDNSNYKLPAEVTYRFEITSAEVEIKEYPVATNPTYNSREQELVTSGDVVGGTILFTTTNNDTQPGRYARWSERIPQGTNAGDYYVWFMVRGDRNHDDTEPALIEASILKKELTITVDADQGKVYGDREPNLKYTVDGLEGRDSLTGTLSRERGEDAGDYTISQGTLRVANNKGSNYEITFINENKFVITPRTITVTGVRANQKTYDGTKDVELNTRNMNVQNAVRGDRNIVSVSGEFDSKDAGDRTVTLKYTINERYSGNYVISEETPTTIDGHINPLTVTLSWDETRSFDYNGDRQIPNATVTNKVDDNDDVKVTVTSDNEPSTDAGNYTATATALTGKDAGNYALPTGRGSRRQLNVDYTINKVDSVITQAPSARELTYNGQNRRLIRGGTAEGGTMEYRLEGGSWSEDIPTGRNAGEYKVYYRVVGDKNHNDLTSDDYVITVTIKKADPSFREPSAVRNLVYTGNPQVLINAGRVFNGGEMTYTLNGQDISRAQDVVGTDAGTYRVYFKIAETENYNGYESRRPITVEIDSARIRVSKQNEVFEYNGQPQGDGIAKESVTTVNNQPVTIRYGESRNRINSDTVPQITNVSESGKTVYYRISAPNHESLVGRYTITINPAALVADDVIASEEYFYEGEDIEPVVVKHTFDEETGPIDLVKDTDYTIEYSATKLQEETEEIEGVIEDTVTVTVNGTGNYSGTIEKSYTLKAKDYTVEYDANEGTGSIEDETKYYTRSLVLNDNSSEAITRTGYQFKGWTLDNIAEEPEIITSLPVGKPETSDPDTDAKYTVYAVWEANKYKVTFNPNSDSYTGSMEDQEFNYDEEKALTKNAFSSTKKGYECAFGGWAKGDDTFASYADGEKVKNLTDVNEGIVTLSAIWYIDGSKLGGTVDGDTVVVNNDGSLSGESVVNPYLDKTLIIVTPTSSTIINKGQVGEVAGGTNYLNATTPTPLYTVFDWDKNADVTTFELVVNKLDQADSDISNRAKSQGYTIVENFEAYFEKNGEKADIKPSSPVTIEMDMPALPGIANGYRRTTTVFHNKGSIETLTPEISGGRAKIAVDSLSPFAIAYRDSIIPTSPVHNLPNTGITNRTTGYVLLLSVLGVLVALGDKLRKK